MSGKTTCKEVCSTCKCTVTEKPICKKDDKKEKECVATIVGVLSLPESFCKPKDPCDENKCEDDGCGDKQDDCCEDKQDDCCEEKDECVEVYRDLGECLQKAIVKTSKKC